MKMLLQKYLIVSVFSICMTFNIDTDNVLVFEGEHGTHFGYSGVMMKNANGSWVIVGAPKANFSDSEDSYIPGNLFKCKINFTKSTQDDCVPMDVRADEGTQGEENGLMGATVALIKNTLIVCAPHWKSMVGNASFPIGRCFNLQRNLQDFTSQRFTPELLIQKLDSKDKKSYEAALIGFSISNKQYDDPLLNIVLGAPGFFDGNGGLVQYSATETSDSFFDTYSTQKDIFDEDLKKSFKGSLLGYSITSGTWSGEAWDTCTTPIILGAPHFMSAGGIVGSVFVVCATTSAFQGKEMTIQKQFSGEQSGSGFGASVVFDDVNNDGLDDLLVGAPLYHNINKDNVIDKGAVYIYYGDREPNVILKVSGQTLYGTETFGRFGSAIQCVGDINKDGFKDIAIGAPYENDLRGAVYIYHGGKTALLFSQKIEARDIDSKLRSFGWFISVPYDIDENQYPDFMVGSYMNDMAIIFRSRPIIKLFSRMTITPALIPLNSSRQSCQDDQFRPCTTVNICFTYNGSNVPDSIKVNYNISSDIRMRQMNKPSRVFLSVIGNTTRNGETINLVQSSGKNGSVIVTKFTETCASLYATVKNFNQDFFTSLDEALDFEVDYSLSPEPLLGQVPSILDNVPTKIQKSANFSNGCNGTCNPDLSIKSSFDKEAIILGLINEIKLKVVVVNNGDLSHSTKIIIKTSHNTKYIGFTQPQNEVSEPLFCSNDMNQRNISRIVCDFRRMFFQHQKAIVFLRYLVSRDLLLGNGDTIKTFNRDVSFIITAETTSKDAYLPDNIKYDLASIQLHSQLVLQGLSIPDQRTASENKVGYLFFVHTYEVKNVGPSPLYDVVLQLCVPVQISEDRTFLHSDLIQIKGSKNYFEWQFIKFPDRTKLSDNLSTDQNVTISHKRQTSDFVYSEINCNTVDDSMLGIINISINMMEVEEIFIFDISMNISESGLITSKVPIIVFGSQVSILTRNDGRSVITAINETFEVSNEIFIREAIVLEQEFNIWVIVGSSIGGLVLLIVLIVILWKCGFFKRKKKKNVREWKRRSGYYSKRQSGYYARHSSKRSNYRFNPVVNGYDD